MAVCILVASGVSFDVDRYLQSSPFKAAGVFRRGQVPAKDNPQQLRRPDSGFSVLISDTQQPGLSEVIDETLVFLSEYSRELQDLKKAGVDHMLLDFGVEINEEVQRSEYFPPELMAALGRFAMGLVFTSVRIPQG